MTAQLWAEVVELADAFTRYQETEVALFQHARSVGITTEAWRSIQRGGQ